MTIADEPIVFTEFEEELAELDVFSTLDREATIKGLAEEHFPELYDKSPEQAIATARAQIIDKLTPGPEIHIADVKETEGITLEPITISSIRPTENWFVFRLGIERDKVNETTLAALRKEVEQQAGVYAEAVLKTYLDLGEFESFEEILTAIGYTPEKLEKLYQDMAQVRRERYPSITNGAYFMIQDEKVEPLYKEDVIEEALAKLYGDKVFVYESDNEEIDPKEKSATMLLYVDKDSGTVRLKVCLITGKEKEAKEEMAGEEKEAEERYLEGLRIHEYTHLFYGARATAKGEVVKAVLTYDGTEWVARAAQGITYKEALFFATVSEASFRLTNRIDEIFTNNRRAGESIEEYRARIQRNEANIKETLINTIRDSIIKDTNPEKEEWTVATPIPGAGILTLGPFFKAIYGADLMSALLLRQEADRRRIKDPQALVDLATEMEAEGKL